jgi:hypothetical protein
VRYRFLRDNVEKGKIALIHLPTHDQLADIFTKPVDQATFNRSRGEHGVVWTSLGPLPRWIPGPTTRWAPRTTRLALHGT